MDPFGVIIDVLKALLGRSDAAKSREAAADLAARNNLFEPRWRTYPRARAALVHLQELRQSAELHIFDGLKDEPDDSYWDTYLDESAIDAERRAVVNELAIVGPEEARAAFELSHSIFLSAAEEMKTVASLHTMMAREAAEHPEERHRRGTPAWEEMKGHQIRVEQRAIEEWRQANQLLSEFEKVCQRALGG